MRFGAAITVMLALSLLGCGRIQRTKQCSRLIETVNEAMNEIGARHDAGIADSAAEREVAARYERLGADIAALTLENQVLAKAVSEYGEMVRDTARLLRRIADARDRKDPITVAISKRELSNQIRREKLIVMRIDGACQSP